MTELKVLDIGCGNKPRGTVNIDLFPEHTIHRGGFVAINHPERICNFVKADASHLPFRTNSFDLILSSHCLEHLDTPIEALKEWMRVATWQVKFRVPHRFSRQKGHGFFKAHRGAHKTQFSMTWFAATLKNYIHTMEYTYAFFPHKFIPLIRWLNEIVVTIYLKG